ncbi:hypothetical protein F0L68_30385 [Solihabitans fulvus]|uniref:Tachylectin n=1 Tax=Solihabitans fulvus TaxID=1892852 RepID=A0A5B2WS26_9PSEU|nr:hypothetical protein [Solihabitans fulvus]KAA2254491.1 hypothetical protein F0L68_30385 [Solihabitans fulvus]
MSRSPTSALRRVLVVLSAGTLTLVGCLLAGATPIGFAATASQPTAVFVATNGALYGYTPTSPAAPIGPAKLAPPGAPVAAARTTNGQVAAYTIGNDGSVDKACSAGSNTWQGPAPLTSGGFAKPGTTLTAVAQGGAVLLSIVDSNGGLRVAYDYDDGFCGTGWRPPWICCWPPPPPCCWWWDYEFATVVVNQEIGQFAVDTKGEVNAAWGTVGGQWQGSGLTAPGTARPGGGLGVVAAPNAPVALFYLGIDGALWQVHPAPGGGGDEPRPISPAGIAPAGAELSVVAGPNGRTDVFVFGNDGSMLDVASPTPGSWSSPLPVSQPKLGGPGGPLAIGTAPGPGQLSMSGAYAADGFCGTNGRPGHLPFPWPPRRVDWSSDGASGLMDSATYLAAV